MFTPAINASSMSAPPWVIMLKAFCTQVMSPPFLNLLPLADAITTGFTDFEFIMVGGWAKSARGATATVNPAAALEHTKRRLFMSEQSTAVRSVAISCLFNKGTAWAWPSPRLPSGAGLPDPGQFTRPRYEMGNLLHRN